MHNHLFVFSAIILGSKIKLLVKFKKEKRKNNKYYFISSKRKTIETSKQNKRIGNSCHTSDIKTNDVLPGNIADFVGISDSNRYHYHRNFGSSNNDIE